MEGDPLEEDRRQRNHNVPRRITSYQQNNPVSSAEGELQQQKQPQPPKKRLVRPTKPPSNDNERKATTSTTAGVNMELKDPKERKLVRHATASAAYGADAFKGKKKKIIRPWSSGRKKHRNKQNNTGGLGREAYGEELKVELKTEVKEKRLVMARSLGNQDAAKALISGGSLTSEEIAEEKRLMEKRSRKLSGEDVYDDEDHFFDGVRDEDDHDPNGGLDNYDDGEPKLVRPASSTILETEDDAEPKLVQLSSSIVREPEDDDEDKPNLVRMSTSIVRPLEDENTDEPNLVRLESSIVMEPEEDAQEELTYYTRSNPVQEEEEQRLVRAVPAAKPPSPDEPKLVRPNIVKEKTEGPKLMKPNIVKAQVEGPKLVRPNFRRAEDTGPKLVRANIQKEIRPESNLVRPKNIASSTKQVEDFMYGANAATSSPTGVPVNLKSKVFVKPAFTGGKGSSKISTAGPKAENSENFMYGSTRSSASPTSVSIDGKPKEYTRDMYVNENDAMESLMYGASQAATSPTAVSIENPKMKGSFQNPDSTFDNPMDSLMYGANQATSSPVAIPLEVKSKKSAVRAAENAPESSASDGSTRFGASQDSLSPNFKAMDDLMYGYQGSGSSPTSVKIETKPTKFVKPERAEDSSQESIAKTSTTLYPDGDKRKKVDEQRLVRASASQTTSQTSTRDSGTKRYVKPSTSSMGNAVDWDAANPTSTSSNPTAVKIGTQKVVQNKGEQKKYVQASTSLMDNVPDWDAVAPATSSANPSVVNVDGGKLKKGVEYSEKEKKSDPVAAENPKKKYVQPSTSMMDRVPDWDAVQPTSSTANPSVVNVEAEKSTEEVEYGSDEKEEDESEAPKKKYVQPSASLMDRAPDWDAVAPATSTGNPSVVNVVMGESKKKVESPSEMSQSDAVAAEKPKKKYVQPSISQMDRAPDWDAVAPATSTANPSVVSVDSVDDQKAKKEVEFIYKGDVTAEKSTKRFVQPSTSMMDRAPDWDAVAPSTSTSNPSQVYVGAPQQKREVKAESGTDKPKKKKYVKPSASLMDSAQDWNAVQPAISTANPSVVNVDGINNTGKEKRYVRPGASNVEGEEKERTKAASVDTQVGDEDENRDLPAEIAHAAGSSSDGWTPEAHFPSDEDNPGDKTPSSSGNKRRTATYSTMENYDPDALPRPTGVIPLTVSSSAKDKTQLFRGEHSLEPVEDETESESNPKKLFLYDGSNAQPKDPWDFTMEGGDTKLDENLGQKGSGRLEEKTVSPFTRNVSKKNDPDTQ